MSTTDKRKLNLVCMNLDGEGWKHRVKSHVSRSTGLFANAKMYFTSSISVPADLKGADVDLVYVDLPDNKAETVLEVCAWRMPNAKVVLFSKWWTVGAFEEVLAKFSDMDVSVVDAHQFPRLSDNILRPIVEFEEPVAV